MSEFRKDDLSMDTKYVISSDGAKIAYSLIGKGPALLLVHGGAGRYDKSLWLNTKWIDRLKEHFLIITPDIRGYGESNKSENPNFYSINNILEDFNTILKECNIADFYYLGWSYGANIGFQMCKNNKNIKKAICVGGCFGDYFYKQVAPRLINIYEELNYKKKTNSIDEMNLSDDYKKWIKGTNLDILIAQYKAWENWPGVNIADVNTKLAIYSGTNDNKELLEQLSYQEEELVNNNIKLKIFENLDHYGLISDVETVMPWILEFLLQ